MKHPLLSSFSLSDNIIGFIIDGPYDKAMIENVQTEIKKKLEVYEKLNFYIEDTANAEISLVKMIINLPFKIRIGNRFDKIAIVTDRNWMRVIRNFENLFLNADLRVYSSDQRMEAIQWISQ